MAGWPPERQVFVTVGTTEFDALIEAVDSDAAHAALAALGYTRVLFQVGRGSARPRGPAGSRSSRLPTACFDFAPSLDEHVGASALVISHAGAGSIMDALERKKPLVVVVNDGLMDNHQTELADVRSSSERARSPLLISLCAPPRLRFLTILPARVVFSRTRAGARRARPSARDDPARARGDARGRAARRIPERAQAVSDRRSRRLPPARRRGDRGHFDGPKSERSCAAPRARARRAGARDRAELVATAV